MLFWTVLIQNWIHQSEFGKYSVLLNVLIELVPLSEFFDCEGDICPCAEAIPPASTITSFNNFTQKTSSSALTNIDLDELEFAIPASLSEARDNDDIYHDAKAFFEDEGPSSKAPWYTRRRVE